MPKKRSILTPYRLSRKEIQEIREKARQAKEEGSQLQQELQRAAAEAAASQATQAAAREQLIATAKANAIAEAKSVRRRERIEESSFRRAAIMADWAKRKKEIDPSPSTDLELGSPSGIAKPLAAILRSR